MSLHVVALALFLGSALVAVAAIVGPYRTAMAVLRTDMAAANTKRAASMEARPLPVIEPLPAQPAYGAGSVVAAALSAPLGQPIRLRRQRRLRRASLDLLWLQRQSLRLVSQTVPALAVAGDHSYAR